MRGPVYGTGTHRLSVIINDQEKHHIELKAEHIQLIVDNIGDISALRNIFGSVMTTGEPGIAATAAMILASLVKAEREAGDRPRIS